MKKYLWIFIVVALIVTLGVLFMVGQKEELPAPQEVIEDTDVEPEEPWLTASSAGFDFSYPETLDSEYAEFVDWPPVITVSSEPYTCTEGGETEARAGQTGERIISGVPFCVTEVVEGAAGSVYHQYAYATDKNGQHIILTFTTRSVQCGNYPPRERMMCEREQRGLDIDSIVAKMITSIKN